MNKLHVAVALILGAGAGAGLFAIATCACHGAGGAPGPSFIELSGAEHRQIGAGKADIYVLARGANAFVGRLELAPGAKVPLHVDDTEETLHILQGGGRLTIDGQVHELRTGTTALLPGGAEVSFENGPERLVALQVFAGPGPAAKYDKWKRVASPPTKAEK